MNTTEDGLDTLVELSRAAGGGGFSQYWYHRDDQNNVVALSNSTGSVVEDYEYLDYGKVANRTSMSPLTGSPVGNRSLFSGREIDWETGLYQFRNRYLDPIQGRFVSRDPLGPWGDTSNLGNAQSYCTNNPWSLVDPLGLDCAYPAGALPPSVKGDTRTGSSDPQGVKGDCKSHGSVSGKKGKSGRRLSDNEYQAKKRANATAAAAKVNQGGGCLFAVHACIDEASDSSSASAEVQENIDEWLQSTEVSSLPRGSSGASTGLEYPSAPEEDPGLVDEVASDVVGSLPVVGTIHAGFGVIFGKDPITGQAVSRGAAAVGLIPGAKAVKKLWKWGGKGWRAARRWFSSSDEVLDAAKGASGVSDALKGLRAGRSSGVKVVDSADELNGLFGRLSSGGKAVEGSTYPGRLVELPDGTTVGLRTGSRSGGPTIDIKLPGGTLQKVHVQQ